MKVSLYIRNHSTRRYELTKLSTIYPMGTIFVLRYGTTWETLPQGTTFIEARVLGQSMRHRPPGTSLASSERRF